MGFVIRHKSYVISRRPNTMVRIQVSLYVGGMTPDIGNATEVFAYGEDVSKAIDKSTYELR